MKKKGIPVFVLLLVLLVLIGLAAAAFVFLKTDIFKSPDELFIKNFMSNRELLTFLENENDETQIKILNENNYMSTGSLTVASSDGFETNVLNAITTIRRDKENNRIYKDITLKNEGNDVINVSYINSDDIYALKCEDILPYYFGIRNDNLKELVKEYIGEQYAESIPDKIDLNDTKLISEEELKTLMKTYLDVINENIPKECYTKNGKVTVNYNGTDIEANEYELKLNIQHIKNIITQCLQKAKSDVTTINILKKSTNNSFSIEDYTKYIDEIIKSINENEPAENTELKFKVYENTGNCIKTIIEINLEDQYEKNQIVIEIENISNNSKSISFRFTETYSGEEYQNIGFKINIEKTNNEGTITNRITVFTNGNNELNQVLSLEKKLGSINNNTITNMITLSIQSGSSSIESTYNKNIQIVDSVDEIPELKNNNSIIINNYKKAQIEKLIQNTVSKKMNVVANKLRQAGVDKYNIETIYVSIASILLSNSEYEKIIVPAGALGLGAGIYFYNRAANTISEPGLDKMAARQHNGQFEPYLNKVLTSVEAKSLLDTAKSANVEIDATGLTTKEEIGDQQCMAEAFYGEKSGILGMINKIKITTYIPGTTNANNQKTNNQETNTVSSDEGINKLAARQHNGQFEPYLNKVLTSVEAKSLLDTAKSANVEIDATGLTTKEEIGNQQCVAETFYDETSGKINKIKITVYTDTTTYN